jgi:copper homeostasis protein
MTGAAQTTSDAVDPLRLEVCVASVGDAVEAAAGGADRVELNVALELGGLTPSTGLLQEVHSAVSLPVICMLRPRRAGFCYGDREWSVMLRDLEQLLAAGAAGIAFGFLGPERQIDLDRTRRLVALCGDRETVFHRAFDCTSNLAVGLEQLIDLGVRRVLTSGGAATALQGSTRLASLRAQAARRIEILAGSGVKADNIRRLQQLTGCRQFHGSFRHPAVDPADPVDDSQYGRTDRRQVAAARRALARPPLEDPPLEDPA